MRNIAQLDSSATAPSVARATDAVSLTQERTDCVVNGYWVGEVRERTKGKLKPGWPEVRGVPAYDSRYTGTIIICEGLRVLDFDIADPELLREVMRLAVECGIQLGETIYRKRDDGSIRAVFLFRAQRGKSSDAWPPKRRFKLIGADNLLEALGAGQQFVAFGQHEKGAHYIWPVGSPRDRYHGELPVVTEAQLNALAERLEAAGLLAKEERSRERAGGQGGRAVGGAASAALEPPLRASDGQPAEMPAGMAERVAAGLAGGGRFSAGVPDDRVTVEDAVGILSVMPNDYPVGHPLRLNRDQWCDLSYACHAILNEEVAITGADPEKERRLYEAFKMFSDSFCEEAGKPAQSAWILWDSTRDPQKITAGTLIHAARERIENFVSPGQE